ncbi:hypothetical protein F5144DRAFT_533154 [Chaetomium tenue]|uniref:Uncharacterized protein n=1 Tax=Chaetomium tenue TaxID=1854479 RepID=A0ACB7P7U1_9PEZI|nr:hypothetical protein F5144DRAFT_533154 [Chaetomium globosum]
MTPDKNQDGQGLPTPVTINTPSRTDTQQGKSNRRVSLLSLPPLKPAPMKFTPSKVGFVFERFHTPDVSVHGEIDDHARNLQVSPHSGCPGPVHDDGDDPFVPSKRPLGCNIKHDRRTGNGMRSLRRRSHLIFNKAEAKGYKRLDLDDEPDAPKPAQSPRLRYRFGDGFSGREAKPNGSNLLTRSGKQSTTSPYVGILDLTQSLIRTPERKRKAPGANTDDSPFLFAPKKKSRTWLEPKALNQQAKPHPITLTTMKRTTSALGETDKAGEESLVPEPQPKELKGNGHTEQPQVPAIATKDSQFHLHTPTRDLTMGQDDDKMTRQDTFDDGDDDELDLIPSPKTWTETLIMPADDPEDDDCKTHVSETSSRPAGELRPSGREFRRVNTL